MIIYALEYDGSHLGFYTEIGACDSIIHVLCKGGHPIWTTDDLDTAVRVAIKEHEAFTLPDYDNPINPYLKKCKVVELRITTENVY